MSKPLTAPQDLTPTRKRGRGRPPLSESQTQAIRDHIKLATASVFAEHGYHGVSVELIIQGGEISRPTFYRYFKNTEEVIELLLKEANDRLIDLVVSAIRQADGPLQKAEAGLLAWRRWGEETGPLLRAIFAEMHDVKSPAAGHRQRVLEAIAAELNQMAHDIGRQPFDSLQVESFVIGVEYLGYRYHFGPEPASDALWLRTRHAMMRLAVGLLGGAFEWGNARQLAQVLQIPMD